MYRWDQYVQYEYHLHHVKKANRHSAFMQHLAISGLNLNSTNELSITSESTFLTFLIKICPGPTAHDTKLSYGIKWYMPEREKNSDHACTVCWVRLLFGFSNSPAVFCSSCCIICLGCFHLICEQANMFVAKTDSPFLRLLCEWNPMKARHLTQGSNVMIVLVHRRLLSVLNEALLDLTTTSTTYQIEIQVHDWRRQKCSLISPLLLLAPVIAQLTTSQLLPSAQE